MRAPAAAKPAALCLACPRLLLHAVSRRSGGRYRTTMQPGRYPGGLVQIAKELVAREGVGALYRPSPRRRQWTDVRARDDGCMHARSCAATRRLRTVGRSAALRRRPMRISPIDATGLQPLPTCDSTAAVVRRAVPIACATRARRGTTGRGTVHSTALAASSALEAAHVAGTRECCPRARAHSPGTPHASSEWKYR